MEIKKITDKAFENYGSIVALPADIKAELDSVMAKNDVPASGTIYVADDEKFANSNAKLFFEAQYGLSAVQLGFCNGNGTTMDALEWHKSPENIYAVTDIILLLGKMPLVNNRYDSSNLECFFVPAGTLVELDALVLHYAPIKTQDGGFKALIVLPKGKNEPLTKEPSDKRLRAINKWLIAHRDIKDLIADGAVEGIDGENVEIIY